MVYTLALLLALTTPDAGVKAKSRVASAPKAAPAPVPKPKVAPPPPTASKPAPFKAGAWNRAWRRAQVALEENGDLLVGVVIQTDKGAWIEHLNVLVPADGGPVKTQHGQVAAEKTPPALQKALVELVKQVDAMVSAAAHGGRLNR